MNPIKKMIDSVLSNNVSEFQGDFDSEIKSRIGLQVSDKKGGISSTLLNPNSSGNDIEGVEFTAKEQAELTRRLTHSLQFVRENNDTVVVELMNGDRVDLAPDNANNLVSVHDALTEENQADFRNQIMRDKASFSAMVEFATENKQ